MMAIPAAIVDLFRLYSWKTLYVTVPALVFSFPPEQFSVSVKAGKVKTTKYLSRYLVRRLAVRHVPPPSPLHEAQSGRASARTIGIISHPLGPPGPVTPTGGRGASCGQASADSLW